MTDSVTVVTPALCLGTGGIKPDAFETALEAEPDVIAVDAGSLDFGPYYLATGTSFASEGQVREDLELILPAAAYHDIPTIIGTAGGSGASPHVKWTRDIIEDIASEYGLQPTVSVLQSDVDGTELQTRLSTGDRTFTPVGHDEQLTEDRVAAADHIVGQMGVEPIADVLEQNPDIVVAGRACDNAVIGAYPVAAGFPKGLALHMGSILECADFAAKPKPDQADALAAETHATVPMIGTITNEDFTVRPADDRLRCTAESIAAHTLYERRDPRRSVEPGGVLDVSECEFEELGDDSVRVTGSEFSEAEEYTVKLEGAGTTGHRALSMCGVRDSALIEQVDDVLDRVKAAMYEKYDSTGEDQLSISFRVYGKDGVMGDMEPHRETMNHELGVLTEVIAHTPQLAKEVCSTIEMRLFHGRYETVPQSGAVALPFSPNTFSVGETAELTVYHTITVDTPDEFISVDRFNLGQHVDGRRDA